MSFSLKPYFDILNELLGQSPGCPWCKDQTFTSICQYVIEEAYEVLDASKQSSKDKLAEELGDLLFTISFLMSMAKKEYQLDFDTLAHNGAMKMKRRSPHVFEDPKELTLDQLRIQWEATKAKEREAQNEDPMQSVASSLPCLHRAMKWAELAHKYGYEESFEEHKLEDQLLKLIFKSAKNCQNPTHLLEERLKVLEKRFQSWMDQNGEVNPKD